MPFVSGMIQDSEDPVTPAERNLIEDLDAIDKAAIDRLVAEGKVTEVFKWLLCEVYLQKKPLSALRYFLSLEGVDVNDPAVQACSDAAGRDCWDVLNLLIENGVDVNEQDPDTLIRPLDFAIRLLASAKTIRLLLDHGADIHARDALGAQPLHYAVYYGNLPVIDMLWKRGARSSSLVHGGSIRSGIKGLTLMHLCVESPEAKNKRDLLRRLLLLGLDIDALSIRDSSAFEAALLTGDDDTRDHLIAYGANIGLTNITIVVPRLAGEDDLLVLERVKTLKRNKHTGLVYLKLLKSVLNALHMLSKEKAETIAKVIGMPRLFGMAAGQGRLGLLQYIVVRWREKLSATDFMTALFGAATAGQREVVEWLLPYMHDDERMQPLAEHMGTYALTLASAQRRQDVFMYLVSVNVPVSVAGTRLQLLAQHEEYADEHGLEYRRMFNALADRQRLAFALGRDFFFERTGHPSRISEEPAGSSEEGSSATFDWEDGLPRLPAAVRARISECLARELNISYLPLHILHRILYYVAVMNMHEGDYDRGYGT